MELEDLESFTNSYSYTNFKIPGFVIIALFNLHVIFGLKLFQLC